MTKECDSRGFFGGKNERFSDSFFIFCDFGFFSKATFFD